LSDHEPNAGDLVWTDFNPQFGREQAGRRPALILSPVEFWRVTKFVFLAPVTSKIRPFLTSVVLPANLKISGEVLLSQARSIDTLARPIIDIGDKIEPDLLAEARAKLAVLFGIES
jgi:mRNA interferase MazF